MASIHRLIVSVIVLGAVVAPMLVAHRATACTCGFPATEAEVLESIAQSDIAVVASVDGFSSPDSDGLLVMSVERVLNDRAIPVRLVVNQTRESTEWINGFPEYEGYDHGGADCSLTLTGEEGERYLVTAAGPVDEPVQLSMCSATARVNEIERAESGYRGVWAAALELDGQPPDAEAPSFQEENEDERGDNEDVPWVPIVVLAVVVPLAVLLVPSFVRRGGGGSRGSEE